jgi:membrane fusion protein, copper/silver efflux system
MKAGPDRPRGTMRVPMVAALAVATIAAGAGFFVGIRHAVPDRGAQDSVTTAGTSAVPTIATTASAPTDAAGRKVLYWHDPMAPGQKFDKPGKSPFMDMQLVPVYAEAAADGGGIAVSARQQQSFGVRVAVAKEGTLDTGFTAVGAVGIDERSLVAVQARSQGYVERLAVRAQYDRVAAGQPLAELYVPEWLAAQEELLALKASALPSSALLADAARQRLRLLGMPDAEIARIERDGKPSVRVTVTAPQAGIVWEIGARDGMAVMPGTTLFKLAGTGTVWVTAEVPEAQSAPVHVGASVEARVAAFPERIFKGSVNALLPEINAQTRTVRARIVLANPDGMLKPGMFATVGFGGSAGKSAVLVPAEAVIQTGKRSVVIVESEKGTFTPVEVEVGRESGDLAEIRKGLAVGQRVVVSSQFLIDSEANLKGVLNRIAATGAAAAEQAADPHAGHTMPAAGAGPVHKAEGIVRSVGDEILIKHGAIPTAGMGAMTMAFKAPPAGVPKDVTPGTGVRFEFVQTPQGDMQLTSIVPAPSALPARTP